MKVFYDNKVDALYLKFGNQKPEGVTEVSEGINLDMTSDGKLVGIEILNASERMDVKTFLSYSIEVNESEMLEDFVQSDF